jgi:restriction system protein
MAIPDYETIMLPLLQFASDGEVHQTRQAIEHLANHFQLTEEERKDLLPSGTQARFDNRVNWARSYLGQAGLLASTARGSFVITGRGLQVLATPPARIDRRFLEQFEEFQEFQSRKKSKAAGAASAAPRVPGAADNPDTATPEELLESNYQSLRENLAQEILDRIAACSPAFFEQLVVDLLVKMGYGGSRKDAGEAIGRTGDDGIDGIIKEDRLGLDVVHIQAKRWKNTVGRPDVQSFAGSLEGNRSRKGVFITTSNFSQDARDYVKRIEKKIILIDGETLANLMIDYRVGVSEVATYSVCRLDADYYEQ